MTFFLLILRASVCFGHTFIMGNSIHTTLTLKLILRKSASRIPLSWRNGHHGGLGRQWAAVGAGVHGAGRSKGVLQGRQRKIGNAALKIPETSQTWPWIAHRVCFFSFRAWTFYGSSFYFYFHLRQREYLLEFLSSYSLYHFRTFTKRR